MFITILDTLMKCNSSRTLQHCLQQRRKNASLQHLYNIGNSVGMGVVGHVITPTQSLLVVCWKYHKLPGKYH